LASREATSAAESKNSPATRNFGQKVVELGSSTNSNGDASKFPELPQPFFPQGTLMIKNIVAAIGLCLMLANALPAQDASQEPTTKPAVEKTNKKKGGKKLQKRKTKATKQITREFAAIELTAEQKTKLETLVDEKIDKLVEIEDAIEAVIPKDKRKQRRAAFKTAKQSGKNYKEATKAALVEIGVSEDDQKKIDELSKSRKTLMDSIRTSLTSSFSQEQKDAIAAAKKAKRKESKKKRNEKQEQGKETSTDASLVSVTVSLPGMT